LTELLDHSSILNQSTFTGIALQHFDFKKVFLFSIATILGGCTGLHGSFEQRSQQLASGLQKAYQVPPSTAQTVAPVILTNAKAHDIPPLTLAGLIQQESSYRSSVTSSAGAVGLTQVMPRYWQKDCPGDLYNININVACGSYILAKYEKSSGSLKKGLAYYNVGPSNYENNWKMKRQGKRYAKQVKQKEKLLKKAL
jgi:soluble lytic murein transglycosylase-like protein